MLTLELIILHRILHRILSQTSKEISSQDVMGVLGQETISTQTSPSRINSINSSQVATSSRMSNKFFKNTPNSTDFGMQTENSILDLSETRKEKNRKAIKDLELEIDQAMNRNFRISNSTTNFLDLTLTPSDSQRIQVPIYPPALGIWKQLRSLQTRKIILQVRSEFYKKIREENGIPEWAVMFNPPHNLLQTERSIKAVVGFRAEMARNNLQMLEDLFSEEIERISKEINVSMASLRVHYDDINSTDYDLEQATGALNRFMLRAQTQEQSSMMKEYNSIMEAPHAALWKNLPSHVSPPASAMPPKPQVRMAGNSGRMTNSTTRTQNSVPSTSTGQNFQAPVRRGWQPSRGEYGRGRGRGSQNRVQKRNSTKDPKKTLHQMMEFLLDQM